jgi:hypothetical protein
MVKYNKKHTKSNAQFKKELEQIHGGQVKALGKYTGVTDPIQVQCLQCDRIWMSKPDYLLSGRGCGGCKKRQYSTVAVTWLNQCSNRLGVKVQHAKNGGEVSIPGTKFKVDGINKRTKTVFEFYGDAFHGNPKVYAPEQKCHPYNKEVTAAELFKTTKDRERRIKKLGYKVVSIWESDFIAMRQNDLPRYEYQKTLHRVYKKPAKPPNVVLGMDVGIRNFGVCAVTRSKEVIHNAMLTETITDLKGEEFQKQFFQFYTAINTLLDRVKPECIVIERFQHRGGSLKGNPGEICPCMIGIVSSIASARGIFVLLVTAATWKNRLRRSGYDLEVLYRQAAKYKKIPTKVGTKLLSHQVDAMFQAEYGLAFVQDKETTWALTKPKLTQMLKALKYVR